MPKHRNQYSGGGHSEERTCVQCGKAFRRPKTNFKHPTRAWCSPSCYHSWRRGRERVPWLERFWSHVAKTNSCWLWTGTIDGTKYGTFTVTEGATKRIIRAHRLSWEIHFGPPPEDLFVLHHCDIPPCVRPDHLFLGTNAENIQDARRKGRLATKANGRHGSITQPARFRYRLTLLPSGGFAAEPPSPSRRYSARRGGSRASEEAALRPAPSEGYDALHP